MRERCYHGGVRVTWRLAVILAVCVPARVAAAQSDDSPSVSQKEAPADTTENGTVDGASAGDFHVGAYGAGWISNYFHDFYAESTTEVRELERLSPAVGLRFSYFFHDYVGAEAELQYTMAKLKSPNSDTPIYGLRAHVLAQLPGRMSPFAVLGYGMSHLSSPDAVLGSDTDYFLHAGAGVLCYFTDNIAIRLDARWLRGPASREDDQGANYGEIMLGFAFSPKFGSSTATGPKPEPEPDVEPEPEPEPDGDLDPDMDGIVNAEDKCPTKAEDLDGFEDDDGCPEPDNDKDFLLDAEDQCPSEAEDKDGFEDDDGCPDLDNDKDGVPDVDDGCPDEPEDVDGYQDRDGCDDPDNDKDGIPDVIDQCAIEAETINGNADDDGCPDDGDSLVMLMPARIEVFESVQFRGNTARIHKKSHSVLAQVGATLRANRDILKLGVHVHVHPRGAGDLALSKERAVAVRKWLIDWGVEPERLEPKGFGSRVLLVPATSKGAAKINDRVEFTILEKRIGAPK